jgi:CHAT domain-containing protein/Tfp pilus assembly protein PilF
MKKLFFLASLLIQSYVFAQSQNIFDDLEKSYYNEEFENCVKFEKQVEQLFVNKKDSIAANAFSYLGDSFYQLGNVTRAIVWQEKEKNLREQLRLQDNAGYSVCLFNLANSYIEASRNAEAVFTARLSIENDRQVSGVTSEQYASSVMNASDIFLQADKFNEAEKLLLSTIRQQKNNSINQGVLLTKLGDVYTLTSQFSKATRALQSGLKILTEKTGDRSPETIRVSINLAILFTEQGKLPEAEEIYERVLSNMSPEDPAFGPSLNNQALVYKNLGQTQKAEQKFVQLRSIDSVTVGTAHPDFAISLSNLGLVYIDQLKFKQAEAILTRALDIQKKNNESKTVSYATKLNNLARVYQATGNFDNAIKAYEEALAIFKKNLGESSPSFATTAFNLGMTNWKAGKAEVGIKYIKQSATIRASKLGKRHPKYSESAQKIAEYYWQKKQFKEARQQFNEVFSGNYFQIESTFPGLTEEEKSKFFYTNIKPSFEKFVAFTLEARQSDPDVLGDALNNQINTKGSILYATEKVKRAISLSNDSTLMYKFELWQAQREQIAKAYSENTSPASLDSLQQSADKLEKDLARRSMVFQNQVVRKKIGWQDIQRALQDDEVAIEAIRFKSYSPINGGRTSDKINYAFFIVSKNKNAPELVVLENGKELETKFLNFYRNSVKFLLEDNRSFDNYFKSIFDYLQGKDISKIYFSPDGVYNQINLNTIKTPDGKFLIDAYDIRLVTNTREIIETRQSKSPDHSSILIGFPKFNLQHQTKDSASSKSVTRSTGLTRSLRGGLLRYMRGEDGIATLPGTQIEIQKISSITPNSKVYTQESASEETVKSVHSPDLLHIATHGYFLEENEALNAFGNAPSYFPNPLLKSGIILAGAESFLKTGVAVNEFGDDGILTAYEAMNLNLDDTDLVVLSACETGLGEIMNGEGVYGLQRAFKLAGAQNLIMSLWSVDDAATQELMTNFYTERLKINDTSAAFRSAQKKLKEKFPHPFYWGAFVLIGI